jgi:hypothetical protein
VVVVSPQWVRQGPTIAEVCARKVDARVEEGGFRSGTLADITRRLAEAVDIPVDMVYALLVAVHRDVEHAGPLVDFLEETNRAYAPGTVAMAYFENHDSPRATQVWHDRFAELLQHSEQARSYWQALASQSHGCGEALLMALLKNLQTALVDSSAGSASGCVLGRGLELGSEWGEQTRTDFETETLLNFAWAGREPNASLVRAYVRLLERQSACPEFSAGEVYFHRNNAAGGDFDDRILAFVRYSADGAVSVAHNLDPCKTHRAHYDFDYLPGAPMPRENCFDSYEAFAIETTAVVGDGAFELCLMPLQTLVWRLG